MNTLLDSSEKASIRAAKELPHYSFFNDTFRDMVKGSVFFPDKWGFISGNFKSLENVLRGSCGSRGAFSNASQSINFVECHDNHTLYDWLSILHPHEEEEKRIKRQQLALVLTIFSSGVPFLHAGQEFYRTKYGFENSYSSPDEINWFDWKRRDRFIKDTRTLAELLSIRRAQSSFRLSSPEEIEECTSLLEDGSTGIIVYRLTNPNRKNCEEWQETLLLMNGRDIEAEVEIPLDGGRWLKAAGKLKEEALIGKNVVMEPLSFVILYKPYSI